MNLAPRPPSRASGFTLLELIFSISIGGLLLAGMIAGFGAFQAVFAASDDYYRATSDEMRVLDYVGQDIRRATSGTVSNNGQTLTLTLPDYLDTSQNPAVPRTASISATGEVTYGTAGAQPTAVYALTGSSPKQVITRTYTPSSGSAVTTSLTASFMDYHFNCYDPNNSGSSAPFSFGGVGQPSTVTVQLSFAPKFNRLNQGNARVGTTATSTLTLRNHQ